ncbi:hypothetical protein OJ998_01015 [Solirubrobacter taibaiensis]|nr:hypothetical protein [Solirubrobacter taibaiensis]
MNNVVIVDLVDRTAVPKHARDRGPRSVVEVARLEDLVVLAVQIEFAELVRRPTPTSRVRIVELRLVVMAVSAADDDDAAIRQQQGD